MESTGPFPFDQQYTFVLCVFPFIYQGQSHTGCITSGRELPWCSITSNYDIDGLWGDCNQCAVTCSTDCTFSLGGRTNPSCLSSSLPNGWGYCDPQIDYLIITTINTTTTTPPPTTSGNSSIGAIVGGVVGGVIAVVTLCVVLVIFLRTRRNRMNTENLPQSQSSITLGSKSQSIDGSGAFPSISLVFRRLVHVFDNPYLPCF